MSNCNEHNDCIDFNHTASVHDCASTEAPTVVTPGINNRVTMKVPIVLAERTVSTSLSANINFPHPVLEIKDIKKRVKIVQCSLVLEPAESLARSFDPVDAHLFIKGFVRKNIQYASPTHLSS